LSEFYLYIKSIILYNLKSKKTTLKMMQKVEVFGEVPLARFGHTITQGKINLAYIIL